VPDLTGARHNRDYLTRRKWGFPIPIHLTGPTMGHCDDTAGSERIASLLCRGAADKGAVRRIGEVFLTWARHGVTSNDDIRSVRAGRRRCRKDDAALVPYLLDILVKRREPARNRDGEVSAMRPVGCGSDLLRVKEARSKEKQEDRLRWMHVCFPVADWLPKPGISCEAVPASDLAGAGMRRHVDTGNHAAESFVSFIPLLGGPSARVDHTRRSSMRESSLA